MEGMAFSSKKNMANFLLRKIGEKSRKPPIHI
jgi:hypothetical protein